MNRELAHDWWGSSEMPEAAPETWHIEHQSKLQRPEQPRAKHRGLGIAFKDEERCNRQEQNETVSQVIERE